MQVVLTLRNLRQNKAEHHGDETAELILMSRILLNTKIWLLMLLLGVVSSVYAQVEVQNDRFDL